MLRKLGRIPLAAAIAALSLLVARDSSAFAVFDYVFEPCGPGGCPPGGPAVSARESLEQTSRWSANPSEVGLADGIQVAIDEGFLEAIGITEPDEQEAVRSAMVDSFRVWENGMLRFDITFDGPAEPGVNSGLELDVLAVPGGDPALCGSQAGCAHVDNFTWSDTRILTNGEIMPGWLIQGADIYINLTTVGALLKLADLELYPLAMFQHLMSHEIGHTLGLHHPTYSPAEFNFDTDGDPFNEMEIAPSDPFAGLMISAAVDCNAIMVNWDALCDPRTATDIFLHPDDLGGRDVLYPVPEPSTLVLLAAGIGGFCARATRPKPWRRS